MWNPRQLPTTPSDIDKAIVRFSERKERYVPRREALDRIKVLRSKKIQLPLQTKFVLVRSGGAFAQCLLETGDDLCCMEGGADRGFSVLNTAPELADNALSEEVVVELLANQPEAMRAAANLRRPDTGAVPAYGWIGSAKVLKALEPIADVSLWDVRDDNGNSLLHHAATRHASVLSDPRVIEFLRDGCQPRRKLRSFVGATNDDGMTAADLLFDYRHSHSAVEDAILALYTTSNNRSGDSGSGSSGDGGSSGGGSSSGDGRHGPGCNCGPAPRETAVDMLLREHAAMKREETRTRKLVAQEQVAVCFAATADGSAAPAAPPAPPLLAPLSIIESSEVLLAELERWQPSVIRAQEKNDEGAASGGSDRSLRRRKPSANGKGKSSAAAAAAAAAEEAAAVAEEEAAVAAAAALTAAAGASGQRSVTVGHTGRAVVTAWLETASVAPQRWYSVLDSLSIDTILGLMVFVDRFLVANRKELSKACTQALQDAVLPADLGELMVDGAQRIESGDVGGRLLMEALLPLVMERFEESIEGPSGNWSEHPAMPRDIVAQVLAGVWRSAKESRKRADELSRQVSRLAKRRKTSSGASGKETRDYISEAESVDSASRYVLDYYATSDSAESDDQDADAVF